MDEESKFGQVVHAMMASGEMERKRDMEDLSKLKKNPNLILKLVLILNLIMMVLLIIITQDYYLLEHLKL